MRPSAIKSSRAKDSLWVWKEIWIAFVGDGSAWAIVSMHIATSGQSWQLLLFCPSGQHGMASEIAAISVISAAIRVAAAGVTSGAATSPTITKTVSKRPMSRRRFMAHHHTWLGAWEAPSFHIVARWRRDPKAPKAQAVNLRTSISACRFSADKLHEGLPTGRPEQDYVVFLWSSALHAW